LYSLVFLIPLIGCSTTKPAFLPPDAGEPMSGWGEEIHLVKPGMVVTIFLKSGEKVKGEVVEVTPDEVALGRASNYGFQKDIYPAADIERIEFGKPTGASTFIGGVAVGMSVMFALIAIAFAMSGPYNLS